VYHPWESTLQELVERVRGEFGGQKAGEVEALALYRGIAEDEILELDVYRTLIIGVGLKPEDFGLHPDD
jgi:hypothetical protein